MKSIVRSILLSGSIGLIALGCQTLDSHSGVPATRPLRYPIPYTTPTVEGVAKTLQNVRGALETRMEMSVIDPATSKPITYPPNTVIPSAYSRTPFNLPGYPSGVTYAAMISAGEVTGDKAFYDFDARRFQFFADAVPKFTGTDLPLTKNPFHGFVKPDSLDACGAVGASFVKARRAGVGPDMRVFIDRFANYVSHEQYRLPDGTLARKRPFKSCLWLDDMYMSVPFLAQMGTLTGDTRYYDDAAKQVIQISDRLFQPSTGLYTHSCDMDDPGEQPTYYWGRANGWAIMAMCELLDELPENHPQRPAILKLLRAHAKGLASVQSGSGLWHQMLDRPDSYLETSCTAMFTYGIAHAVDRGWLNANIYGGVAIAGWNALTTRIDAQGHVTGTCMGTSYAGDYVYYYNRPAGDDPHGYGPVLMAGSEIIRLLKNPAYSCEMQKGGNILVVDKAPATTTATAQP